MQVQLRETMMRTYTGKTLAVLAVLTALPFMVQAAPPQAASPHAGEEDAAYHTGTSPVGSALMHKNADTSAPPMTVAEFDQARQLYFERCAGCHGVLRKGATGKALTPETTLNLGTDYLKAFIGYGSPGGMPNFLTSGDFNEKEVDLMARYLQQEPPRTLETSHPNYSNLKVC
jgi:nitrite reductase (NO-forming)/hydroxylamine reductase